MTSLPLALQVKAMQCRSNIVPDCALHAVEVPHEDVSGPQEFFASVSEVRGPTASMPASVSRDTVLLAMDI